MQLLIDEHNNESLDPIDPILTGNSKMATFDPVGGLVEKEELNLGLEKLSRELLTKKEKKLERDRKAFLANKAYTWPTPSLNKPNRRFRKFIPANKRNRDNPGEHMGSESSLSSASSVNSFFSSRNYKQAKKRLKGADRDYSSEQHRSNSTHLCDVSNEVVGSIVSLMHPHLLLTPVI